MSLDDVNQGLSFQGKKDRKNADVAQQTSPINTSQSEAPPLSDTFGDLKPREEKIEEQLNEEQDIASQEPDPELNQNSIFMEENELGKFSKGKKYNDPSLKERQIALARKMFDYNNSPQCPDGDCFSYDGAGYFGSKPIPGWQKEQNIRKVNNK
mgnify:CR=1 FL=1